MIAYIQPGGHVIALQSSTLRAYIALTLFYWDDSTVVFLEHQASNHAERKTDIEVNTKIQAVCLISAPTELYLNLTMILCAFCAVSTPAGFSLVSQSALPWQRLSLRLFVVLVTKLTELLT